MQKDLLNRLRNFEDNFTERKLENIKNHDIRRTAVAFTNSVPEGRTGILYIGITTDGGVRGVRNTDSLQKKVQEQCRDICYPPVEFRSEVLSVKGKPVLAVEILHSRNRPHFSGPAYVREDSVSRKASEEEFQKLVESRLDKVWTIQQRGRNPITVVCIGKKLGGDEKPPETYYRYGYKEEHECVVEECNAQFIRLQDISSMTFYAEPLENVTISSDEKKHRPKLVIRWP